VQPPDRSGGLRFLSRGSGFREGTHYLINSFSCSWFAWLRLWAGLLPFQDATNKAL
jgi:hypothetical protein